MNDKIHSYRELIVWQKSMDLVVEIYRVTVLYPKSEQFGLISQKKRCSVSIPSNIAEGRKRGSRKDYRHFLLMAYGSGAELETQIEIAKRLKLVDNKEWKTADNLLSEVMKMLNKITNGL